MKKITFILFAGVIMMGITAGISAKRKAPADIEPVTYKGTVFVVNNIAESMGKVFAYREKDEKLIWEKQLYTVKYDKNLETDVQDVYIKSMKIKKARLEIIDEKGRKYTLDPQSGKLL